MPAADTLSDLDQPMSPAAESALTVLDTLADSGYVPVPARPTPEMLAAGAEAGKTSRNKARRVYEAMLAAA